MLLAVLAAFAGWLSGALSAAFALFGVAVGATSGLLVAPHVVENFDSPVARLFAGLGIVALMVIIGQVAGQTIGRALRSTISGSTVARGVDSLIGAVLQAAAILLVAWLVAIPVSAREDTAAAQAIRGSTVLSEMDRLAPNQLRSIPSTFAEVLVDTGFPGILGPFSEMPLREVPPADPELQNNPIVQSVTPSVVKIMGRAEQCRRALEGSGVVYAPNRVITNAHVVAGTDTVRVEVSEDVAIDANVVAYNPDVDIAVLDVPGLTAPPMALGTDRDVQSGDDAIVLGYPGNGPYHAGAARVREEVTLRGPNIYRDAQVERDVYTLRADVQEGNSGGPLIAPDGTVIGIIFGAALDATETGYALTLDQVMPTVEAAEGQTEPVETQRCVGSA